MALSSQLGDLALPQGVSMPQFILTKMLEYGEKTAVIEHKTGRSFSFQEVTSNIVQCANGLRQVGVTKGDVICMHISNCIEFYSMMFGAALTGSILTTTNPLLTCRELCDQVKDSGATRLIIQPESIGKVRDLLKNDAVSLIDVFVIGEHGSEFRSFEDIMDLGKSPNIAEEIDI
jgi:acyl-CoA synthetase (AMP-forming)/AMP-acid ligase II